MAANSSTSNSKRILLQLVLPILVGVMVMCVVIDYIVTQKVILSNHTSGAYKIERLFNQERKDEIPIFGSSRAAGSYVPEELHEKAFNYGVEKTQFDFIRIMLAKELSKTKITPIVVNFDLEFFETWYGDQGHFIPHQDIPEIREYSAKKHRAFYAIPGIRYFGMIDGYLRSFLGERSGKDHISKGGWFLKKQIPSSEFSLMVQQRLNTPSSWIEPKSKSEDWLDLLKSTDRTIVICMAPYHRSYFESFTNYEKAKNYMTKMDSIEHVIVVDMGSMDLPDSDFKNTTHLNYSGALKFSNALKEYIIQSGIDFN